MDVIGNYTKIVLSKIGYRDYKYAYINFLSFLYYKCYFIQYIINTNKTILLKIFVD